MAENTSAKKALQKLSAQLECSICLDSFKEPKLLPCFHVFCRTPCLEKLAKGRNSFECPTCRQKIPLPPKGVTGFQTDFHVEHLFEIRDAFDKATDSAETKCGKCEDEKATGYCRDCGQFVCDDCQKMHKKWKELKAHQIISLEEVQAQAASFIPPKRVVPYCPKHKENVLKIFCETCSELICNDCTIRLHQGHNYDLVADVFPKHKEEIVSSLKPVRQNLQMVKQSLKEFDAQAMTLNDQRGVVEAEINEEIDRLHRMLEQQKEDLVGELEQLTQQKLKSLAAQRDHVEITHAKLSSCLEYAEGGLETGTEGEVLSMKDPVLKRIKQITTEFDPATIRPPIQSKVELVTGDREKCQTACKDFLTIEEDPPIAENSFATGVGLKCSQVDKETIIEVQTRTKHDQPAGEARMNLEAQLIHTKTNTIVKCDIAKQQKGRYTVTYRPKKRGRHVLNTMIRGKSIRGCPSDISVIPSEQSLCKPVRVVCGFNKLRGTAVNSQGHIIVAEGGSDCISVLTPQGGMIRTFGSRGSGEGELNYPWGVAVDRDDNIYVVDKGNHRIQKFTSEGRFVKSVGSKGSNHLQFNNPIGSCFNKTNDRLYVCDQLNHKIQVLSPDLTFVSSFGEQGSDNGQFHHPLNVACDSANNVYIIDCNNHRVQVFTPEGQFLRVITDKSNGQKLQNPFAIAIDSCDTVYVSERDRHCVNVFTTQGEFITCFGSEGDKEGQFNKAYDISVDQNDLIIVSDTHNNRLQVF